MAVFQEGVKKLWDEKKAGKYKYHCNKKSLLAEPSDLNMSLRKFRFRHSDHSPCEGCGFGVGVLEEGLHLLCFLSPNAAGSIIKQYKFLIPFLGQCCLHTAVFFLKDVTGLLRSGGTYISKFWRILSFWERLYGYSDYSSDAEIKEELLDWLGRANDTGSVIGVNVHAEVTYDKVFKLISEAWTVPEEYLTLDQWIKSLVWTRGKSGDNENTTISLEGKEVRTRRMKALDAVYKSDEEIKSMMYQVIPNKIYILQKSEHSKIRPVAKTSNNTNRQWDWLCDYIERGLKGCEFTKLFSGSRANEELDVRLLGGCRSSIWKLPMDHSSYDHQLDLPMLKACLVAIKDATSVGMPLDIRSDFDRVWQAAWDSDFKSVWVFFKNWAPFLWEGGLPSGFRTTALLGTTLNGASIEVAKDIIAKADLCTDGSGRGVSFRACQGDDVACEMRSLTDANLLLAAMNLLGYKVHPQKTFISRERTEFLQRSFERSGITGYIPRSLLNMRFRSPIQEAPIVKTERLFSCFMNWHLCILRGADPRRAIECFFMESDQIGINRTMVASFLLTPRAYGGIGVTPSSLLAGLALPYWNGKWIKMKVVKESRDKEVQLGAWARRLMTWGITRAHEGWKSFVDTLATTWGIRQAKIFGKVSVSWEWMTPIKPRYECPSVTPAPREAEMWDMTNIPTLIRRMVKQNAIANEDWSLIKPVFRDEVARQRKRVSRTIFEGWLTGEFEVSAPVLDDISLKYGTEEKRNIDIQLRKYILKKDMSLERLKSIVHGLELRIGQIISNKYDYLMGV